MSSVERAKLAELQAELLHNLAGKAALPVGFDATRLQATAESLARKRARAVARAWPALADALGEEFGIRFAPFATATGLPAVGGPLADGRAFAQTLAAAGDLPDSARLAVLAVDLHYQ